MTYEWPQGWIPIYCNCDALIGGYCQQDQPEYMEIHHRCDPKRIDGRYITVIIK